MSLVWTVIYAWEGIKLPHMVSEHEEGGTCRPDKAFIDLMRANSLTLEFLSALWIVQSREDGRKILWDVSVYGFCRNSHLFSLFMKI